MTTQVFPILYIASRRNPKPHCELHFDRWVEFWTLEGKKLGESKVYDVEDIEK